MNWSSEWKIPIINSQAEWLLKLIAQNERESGLIKEAAKKIYDERNLK